VNASLADVRAIGWRLPVVLAAIVMLDEVVALGALGVAPRTGVPLTTRLLAGFVSVLIISVVLSIGRWTWLGTRFARARPSVMVASVVLAVQAGVAASRSMLVARRLTGPTTGLGADAAVFLAGTTLVVLAVLGVLERHRGLSATLVATAAELEAAYARSVDAVTTERARLADRVRGLLEDRLGPTSLRPALFTPERLREVADTLLRPLAHQLARPEPHVDVAPVVPSRRTAFLTVLRELRATPRLRPRVLAATMFLLTFRFSIAPPPDELIPATTTSAGGPGVALSADWTSLGQSIVLHVATFALVLFGSRLLGRSIERHERTTPTAPERSRDWAIVSTGLVMLGLVSLALLRIVYELPGLGALPPVTPTVAIGFTAPLVIITVITSLLPAMEVALAQLRDELTSASRELERAAARANALLDHERRVFARHLHASVQAAVNAASLTIERASADGTIDPDVIERAASVIDAAIARLAEDTASGARTDHDGPGDLDARIAAIVATWEGLATCDITLDATARTALEHDTITRATACDLIAEACANAVIHGHARQLRIGATIDPGTPDELRLVVTDDGEFPDANRAHGLGSRVLTASTTHWRLERDEHGTTLTALVPLR
jgi:hypothetical protein